MPQPIAINATQVLRDSLLYIAAIAVTTAVVWDGSVEWYEALIMVLLSLAYLAFMFSQHRLARWARTLLSRSNSTIVLTNRPDEVSSVSSQVAAKEVVDAAPLPQPQPDPEVAAAVANQISFTKGNQGEGTNSTTPAIRSPPGPFPFPQQTDSEIPRALKGYLGPLVCGLSQSETARQRPSE